MVSITRELVFCLYFLGELFEAEELARRTHATLKRRDASNEHLRVVRAMVDMCLVRILVGSSAHGIYVSVKKDSPHFVHHRFGKPL